MAFDWSEYLNRPLPTLSWCDGPPYAYHWGLEAAKAMLKELVASEPTLPPFDASKYPPMPEVDI
jgi:hypothetical protein